MFYTKISYSVSKNAGKKDVDFRRTGTLTPANEWHLLLRGLGRVDSGPEMAVFVTQSSAMRLSCMPKPVNEMLLIRWGSKVSSISFSSLSRAHSKLYCSCSGAISLWSPRGSKPFSSEKDCGWTQLIVDIPRPNFKMVSESRCFNPYFVISPAILGHLVKQIHVYLIGTIQSQRDTKQLRKKKTKNDGFSVYGSAIKKTCLNQLA